MYDYHDKYKAAKGDTDAQARWAHQLIWEIARHAVGEEIVVYPLMEQHLGQQGRELADEDRTQHGIIKQDLYRLEGMEPGTPAYDSLLDQVMQVLREHNNSEEIKDLPRLEPVIGSEKSAEAAASFKKTKKFVPTRWVSWIVFRHLIFWRDVCDRPHPSAPNRPPLETLVGFLAAPIDKLKDLFTTFPTEEMKHPSH